MKLGNFDREARRASQRVVLEATEAIRAVAVDLYQTVQRETAGGTGSPVASGRLASSTRLSINEIDTTTAPEDPGYEYPSAEVHKYSKANLPKRTIRNIAVSRISARLRTYKLGDKIFVSNSVPYIRKIEVGRHSWQTPDGVFEVSVRDVVSRFKNIRLRVRNV